MYTFFSHSHLSHSRINLLLGSVALLQNCDCADIGTKVLSDHAWVACNFSRQISDGKGPNWSLNRSVINDDLYRPLIEAKIDQFFNLIKTVGC